MNNVNNRREFLKIASGSLVATSLAGCTGDGGSNDGTDNGNGGSDGSDGGNNDGSEGSDGGNNGTDTPAESEFPEQDIRLIIPYGTGGGFDAYARLAAQHLSDRLSVDVLAQNVEGAGGIIGHEQIYNADPDGYTSGIVDAQLGAANQVMEDVEYQLENMTYYAQAAGEGYAIAVGTNTGIETWDDYVAAAQNNELMYFTIGPRSGGIVTPLAVAELTGLYPTDSVIDNMVMYNSRGDGIAAIKRGDVQVMASAYSSLLPYVESGDLRMIMVMSTDDSPPDATPDAETLETAGVSSRDELESMLSLRRLFAGPPDVPDDRRDFLREHFEAVLNDDELLAEAEDMGRPVNYASGEESKEIMEDAIAKWEDLRPLLEEIEG